MLVNGLKIPDTYLLVASQPEARVTTWMPSEACDAYGNDLEAECDPFFPPESLVVGEWLRMTLHVDSQSKEEIAKRDAMTTNLPGSIPFITDFSQIVSFTISPTGEPFCFDFRDNPEEPSIIYLDEWYWRRVAPSFDAFIALYEPYDSEKWEQIHDEMWRRKGLEPPSLY